MAISWLVCVKFKCHQSFAYISEDHGSFFVCLQA